MGFSGFDVVIPVLVVLVLLLIFAGIVIGLPNAVVQVTNRVGAGDAMQTLGVIFLVVVLIGLGALALLLWEPHLEGRNAHATLFEIYFNDPFLAYAYGASIPFFVSLYQAFKLLGYAGQNQVFGFIRLKDWAERTRPEQKVAAIQKRAMAKFAHIKAAFAVAFVPPAVFHESFDHVSYPNSPGCGIV